MAPPNKTRSCGDDLIDINVVDSAAAQELATNLRSSGEWLEVVAGIDSVVLRFDAALEDAATALQRASESLDFRAGAGGNIADVVEIPVRYGGEDGPDFDKVCAQLGMPVDELIALHTSGEYVVDMLGFTPGFAYVGGLDERINVPRLAEPRASVAAGSVGIADGRTGLYALPGPGGWAVIGRTTFRLFDASAQEPFALQPGMRIRFVAVDSR